MHGPGWSGGEYYAYRGLLGGNYHDGEENGMVAVSAQNASTEGTGGYYHTYYGKRTGSTGRVQANVPHSGLALQEQECGIMRFGQSKADSISAAGYIDELDQEIFPFISYESYADRYPACSILQIHRLFMLNCVKRQGNYFSSSIKLYVYSKNVRMSSLLMDMPPKGCVRFWIFRIRWIVRRICRGLILFWIKPDSLNVLSSMLTLPVRWLKPIMETALQRILLGRRDPNEGQLV